MKKLFILPFLIALLFCNRVFAQESTNMVILVDLSKSVAVTSPQGETPCRKNFKAIGRVLETVPAGSRITILGITAESFADPDILLSAQISSELGYFGEKLTSAHQTLRAAWQKRSQNLECNAHGTDILGALMVSGQVFKRFPATHRHLYIFSDMRQSSRVRNTNMGSQSMSDEQLTYLSSKGLIADLAGVRVDVLGVDNIGNNLEYWHALQAFWGKYFENAHTQLGEYSILDR